VETASKDGRSDDLIDAGSVRKETFEKKLKAERSVYSCFIHVTTSFHGLLVLPND
jgi:hypothetical protein